MSHAVNWFQIQGPDGHVLQSFYKSVFDWPMSPAPGPGDLMMVPAQPPDGIAGGVGTSMSRQASVQIYVSVGDIDTYLGKAERAGGHLAMPRMELPNDMGFIGGFTDPAGNWIGLWQPSAKPAPATRTAASGVKARASAKQAAATKAAAPKTRGAPKASAPKKAGAPKGGAKKGGAKKGGAKKGARREEGGAKAAAPKAPATKGAGAAKTKAKNTAGARNGRR